MSLPKKHKLGREPFKKLFSGLKNEENAQRVIKMLNEGYSYLFISKVFGCDHTSILSFKRRKIKEGMVFKKVKRVGPLKNYENTPFVSIEKKVIILGEKINEGKDSYKEYLLEEKKKTEKDRLETMLKARRTIRSLRSSRNKKRL